MSGPTSFSILYSDETKQDIRSLPKTMHSRIRKAIESRLMVDPIAYGKPLRYALSGQRSLRVGDWRVIYTVEMEKHAVRVLAIRHRKEAYK